MIKILWTAYEFFSIWFTGIFFSYVMGYALIGRWKSR